MRERARTAILLFAVFITVMLAGELWYWGALLLALSLAGWEWARLFGQRGLTGSLGGVLGLIWVMMIDARWPDLALLRPGVAAILVMAMIQMVVRTGKGYPEPATSFSVKLAGGLYLGWMGMHLAMLRALPAGDGLYWTLTVLPAIFAADTSAFLVGRKFGKHKLAPRISPKKSREGYIAGVAGAGAAGALMGALWEGAAVGARTNAAHGALVGLLCGGMCIFGDLGISAFKRQMGVKDSSGLLPGHGGFLDRLDTVLIAGALGYYYVLWFVGG